jgi:ABC-type polysaccharide/polyol phosphate transport system ATPase subunit
LGTYYGFAEEAFIILPEKVKLKNVTCSSKGTVLVRWEKCAGATGYQVLYSDRINGTYTSALVTSSQSCILNKLSKGKTSIFISHRLSSTRFCDRIFFIENGKIIETGSHDELMKLNGKYAEIFNLQSYYYKEGAANEKA